MKSYTIEQIRKYLLSQDSKGDILYNLKEEVLDAINAPVVGTIEYQEGIDDHDSGYEYGQNPYDRHTAEWCRWNAGWEWAN